MNKKVNILWVGIVLAALSVGFIFGKLEFKKPLDKNLPKLENGKFSMREHDNKNDKHDFVNPLLDCGDLDSVSNKNINEIKQKVVSFIEEQKLQGISGVAVYFRDLNNGPWFGINEKEGFLPASLLKVPLMMNIFRQSMGDPDFLSRQFVWQGESKNKEYFKAENELKRNQTYTLDEALVYMIRYSDNNSSHILSYALDTSTLLASYSELGIPPPDKVGYSISTKTYASFFRILYNGTFLNKEYSEQALRLLSETSFNKGLVAGVSPTIKVAHKFGERKLEGDNKQLHDCGIIYIPDRPYLLCVMTRSSSSSSSSSSFDKMGDFIAQVSKIVYEGVNKSE